MRAILFVLILAVGNVSCAAEYTCYFSRDTVTADCKGDAEEAGDYLVKRGWVCADIIYINWHGTTETVRCRGYDGSVLDYVSDSSGNFQFKR